MSESTEKVLNYIKKYYKIYGYYPSYREIGRGLDLNSTSTISYHINKLEKAGLISKIGKLSRVFIVRNDYE